MFIQCSDCDYKYLINSADLKPDGRMVECANCNHRWFQEPIKGEDILYSSVPKTDKSNSKKNLDSQNINEDDSSSNQIKNLPSTIVKEKKVSIVNTFLVVFLLVFLFFLFWTLRSYGTNIFVLFNCY